MDLCSQSKQPGVRNLWSPCARPRRYLRLLTALLLPGIVINEGLAEPSVLLFNATLEEARDFTVESASARGWSVPSIGQNGAEFEQDLDDEEDDDAVATDNAEDVTDVGFVARRRIRIAAQFSEEAAGIRVLLRAHELESSQTGEWTTDVTDRYAENLNNALTSLRRKWDQYRDPLANGSQQDAALTAQDGSQDAVSIGIWAYYAERYAQSRGCELTSRGALIESSGPHGEQHRVDCRDGRSLRVLCDQGDCTLR